MDKNEEPPKIGKDPTMFDPKYELKQLNSRVSYIHLSASLSREEKIITLYGHICENRRMIKTSKLLSAAGGMSEYGLMDIFGPGSKFIHGGSISYILMCPSVEVSIYDFSK